MVDAQLGLPLSVLSFAILGTPALSLREYKEALPLVVISLLKARRCIRRPCGQLSPGSGDR